MSSIKNHQSLSFFHVITNFKNHIEFKATINDEFYSLENDARDTGKDWPTWVSHGDLIDFIGIEPHLALPTLENAWSEPLLQLKHNHFSPLLSYPSAAVELMMQSYLTLSTNRFLGFGGLDFQWACLFLNGLSRFGIYFLNGLGSLLMGFHGKLYLHNGLESLLMGFHDFRKNERLYFLNRHSNKLTMFLWSGFLMDFKVWKFFLWAGFFLHGL